MDLLAQLHAHDPLDPVKGRIGQISDGADACLFQLFRRGCAHGKQSPHRKGPHFLRNFMVVQGVYLVGLFEIAGHFGKQLTNIP